MKVAVFRVIHCNDLPGPSVLSDQLESVHHNPSLKLTHPRSSDRISDLETVRIKCSRRSHLGRNVRADRHQNRRNPSHLYLSLDRYDRAVADVRSAAGEQYDVCTRTLVDLVRDLHRSLLVHILQTHRVPHVPDMLSRYTADETFIG